MPHMTTERFGHNIIVKDGVMYAINGFELGKEGFQGIQSIEIFEIEKFLISRSKSMKWKTIELDF